MSRLIDVHPLEEVRGKMKSFQKISARCQLICELVTPLREIKEEEEEKEKENEFYDEAKNEP